ncbi:MAG TPA: LapA family protein [Tepidisphaeraceae bacterium]|nr:LapA family protein [Tepidisphaeraceae bacterium]
MGNIWLKIKIWTKSILFAAIAIYVLLFMLKNSGQKVTLWYWFGYENEVSMLVLVVITFFSGVIGTVLVRTTFTTIRQIREVRQKGRIDKIEREHAEMKARAAMLQTRTAPAPQPGSSVNPNDPLPLSDDQP